MDSITNMRQFVQLCTTLANFLGENYILHQIGSCLLITGLYSALSYWTQCYQQLSSSAALMAVVATCSATTLSSCKRERCSSSLERLMFYLPDYRTSEVSLAAAGGSLRHHLVDHQLRS